MSRYPLHHARRICKDDAGTETDSPIYAREQGFTATGAQGNDVVQLLQDALNRRQVNVKCAALVNDTVGTLLSHAYQSGAAVAGAIFGTGTNGAYLEKMSNLTKDISVTGNHEYMVVNTEWGAFDNEVSPNTYSSCLAHRLRRNWH